MKKFFISLLFSCFALCNAFSNEHVDVITATCLSSTSTSYTSFSNVQLTSDAIYAGNNGKKNGNITLRTSGTEHAGIISTVSGGFIKEVTIYLISADAVVDVYGKNTGYESTSDLFESKATKGTLLGSISSETIKIIPDDNYAYIGIRAKTGTIEIASISITWEDNELDYFVENVAFMLNDIK